jgi:hypothetical protein
VGHLTVVGNFSKSMHLSEGSCEAIAERFFKTLEYDTFYLEYDSPRSGGFESLRFLPKNKNVVLGVVTTKGRGNGEHWHQPAMRLCEHRRRSGGNNGREDVCEAKARSRPGQGVVAFTRILCPELGSCQHLCQLTEHSRNSSNPLCDVLMFPFLETEITTQRR